MSEKEYELIIMKLVTESGSARSSALEAVRAARNGDYQTAEEKIAEAREELLRAHSVQTGLIQQEASGEHIAIGLLMVHAQDHLMNAMTVCDLAEEMIGICKNSQ